MKKDIKLNPITYNCICKEVVWKSYSVSDKKNINISVCSVCQTLTGKGDMKMKNIEKFREKLIKKTENKKK